MCFTLSGIQEVDRAVTRMDANTQQNAAIVEQAAAAAEHMASQAEVLVAAVSRFRTGEGVELAAPRQDAQPAPAETAALPPEAAQPASSAPIVAKATRPAPARTNPAVAVDEPEEWREF